MRLAKIDRRKILEEHVFKGQKGDYIDLVLHDNKDGTDDYGNDGFVCQGVSKEARANGVKGPIIGNWRNVHTKAQPKQARAAQAPRAATATNDGDEVPF